MRSGNYDVMCFNNLFKKREKELLSFLFRSSYHFRFIFIRYQCSFKFSFKLSYQLLKFSYQFLYQFSFNFSLNFYFISIFVIVYTEGMTREPNTVLSAVEVTAIFNPSSLVSVIVSVTVDTAASTPSVAATAAGAENTTSPLLEE